jgi:two-component system, NarL family, invasion response regulator UvrY
MKEVIKVGLVDDHDLFRSALAEVIELSGIHFKVVMTACDGRELIKLLGRKELHPVPDIVIMDLHNPGMDGPETTKWLRSHYPAIKVIVLSLEDTETSMLTMAKLGVCGYLVKSVDVPILFTAIRKVAENEFYFTDYHPEKDGKAFKNVAELLPEMMGELHIRAIWNSLTDNEKEFIKLCCSDNKYREIAGLMKVRSSTIDAYKKRVFAKFQVQSRVGLVILVMKHKLMLI